MADTAGAAIAADSTAANPASSPQTSSPAVSPTATPANGSGAGTPPTGSAPWFASFDDADLRGYTELKKWDKPADAVRSYRELEKLVKGGPADGLLRVPGADAKPEDWGAFWDKVGRPKEAKDYNLPVPEGADRAFADAAAPVLHGLGLSTNQAQGLAKWWNEYAGNLATEEQRQFQLKADADFAALQTEWPGEVYTERMELAKRAARGVGIDADTLDKMESVIGTAAIYRLFAKIGEQQGEAKFVDSNGRGTFGMTPEAASARIKELQADKDFGKRYLNGDVNATAEMDRLLQISSAGAARNIVR